MSPGLDVVTEFISTGLPAENGKKVLWSSCLALVIDRLPIGGYMSVRVLGVLKYDGFLKDKLTMFLKIKELQQILLLEKCYPSRSSALEAVFLFHSKVRREKRESEFASVAAALVLASHSSWLRSTCLTFACFRVFHVGLKGSKVISKSSVCRPRITYLLEQASPLNKRYIWNQKSP